MSTSIRPNTRSASLTARLISSAFVTSSGSAIALPLCPAIMSSSFFGSRAVATTRNPCARAERTNSRPKPLEQPVTNHTGTSIWLFAMSHSPFLIRSNDRQERLRGRPNCSSPLGNAACAGAYPRHVLLSDRFRELGHDLVEMQMLKQFESGGAEDMRVLQNLHGIPVATFHQQRQRGSGNRDQNCFLSGEKPMHCAVVGFVGKAARENPVDIPFHHRRHRHPPQWIDDGENVCGADII